MQLGNVLGVATSTVNVGDTTPAPTVPNGVSIVWSTVTLALMIWTGSSWQFVAPQDLPTDIPAGMIFDIAATQQEPALATLSIEGTLQIEGSLLAF